MKRTRLIAGLAGLVVAIFAADASAFYHPGMGVFMSRDPGAGAGGATRVGAGGAPRVAGFAPMDPTGQYADGANLCQYVRSNPIALVDPTGLKCCLWIDYDGTMYDFGPIPPGPRDGFSPTDVCGEEGKCSQKNGLPIPRDGKATCVARILTARLIPPNPNVALWGYLPDPQDPCKCKLVPVCKGVLDSSVGVPPAFPWGRKEQWEAKKRKMSEYSDCTEHWIIDDNDRIDEDIGQPGKNVLPNGSTIKRVKPQDWQQAVRNCCRKGM